MELALALVCRQLQLLQVPTVNNYDFDVHLPGGGKVKFHFVSAATVATDYFYNARLTATTNALGAVIGYVMDLPDGSQHVYQSGWVTNSYGARYVYLTKSKDAQGFETQFNYQTVVDEYSNPIAFRLSTVADQVGSNVFSLAYTGVPANNNLIAWVTNRFNQTARLTYTEDASGNPHLTGIQDAAGITSTIRYNDSGWPSELVTPYGTNSFAYQWLVYSGDIDRRIDITEPNGGKQIYLFKGACSQLWSGSSWMPDYVPAALVPSTNSLPAGAQLDTAAAWLNSFHWDQKQSDGISTDSSLLTTNQVNRARWRHWLDAGAGGPMSADFALSFEVAPTTSSDGSAWGQITFYDYAGKALSHEPGTQIQPSLLTRKLPDGSVWYEAYGRNSIGNPTTKTNTYGTGNPASTRAFSYTYAANGQDLTEVRRPGNELVAIYAYNSRHQVTNEVQWADASTAYTNGWGYDSYGRTTAHTNAAGLITTYYYNASSGSYPGIPLRHYQPTGRQLRTIYLDQRLRAHPNRRAQFHPHLHPRRPQPAHPGRFSVP